MTTLVFIMTHSHQQPSHTGTMVHPSHHVERCLNTATLIKEPVHHVPEDKSVAVRCFHSSFSPAVKHPCRHQPASNPIALTLVPQLVKPLQVGSKQCRPLVLPLLRISLCERCSSGRLRRSCINLHCLNPPLVAGANMVRLILSCSFLTALLSFASSWICICLMLAAVSTVFPSLAKTASCVCSVLCMLMSLIVRCPSAFWIPSSGPRTISSS